MNIYGNSNDDLNDATLTNTTLQGSTTIVCDDNTKYNLQTPDNGDNLEVLTTDGAGNTYWAAGSGNPFDQSLNTNDNVNFQMVNVAGAITTNTQLTTKLYVDNAIPAPQTLQDVIDTSINTGGGNVEALCIIPYGKFIEFETPDNDFIFTIESPDTINYRITANRASLKYLDSTTSTSSSFIKTGGTNQQYLMADGSSLQYSANSGNSNFYLYNNVSGVMTPPPANGQVGYNNSIQADATILYISHRTRDTIDIDVFLEQLSTVQDVYLQDQENSTNFIKYNITATPTLIPNSYIQIPVLYTATIPPALPNGSGTGLTNFGVNHNILVSFFTNSIEVDLRLSTLETKTQNQTAIPNTTTFTGNIIPSIDNLYDIGNTAFRFQRGYFGTGLRSPIYDTQNLTELKIAPQYANQVTIGRDTVTTTILGTTSINSVYTLPNTAPAVGNVLTCSALGVSSWITPSPTAYSFLYPFPVISKTVVTGAGSRTLACSYTMTTNFTFTKAGIFHPSPGADFNRVGIYRGDLTTGVLVGQTLNTVPATDYSVKPLTVVVGQSLAFTLGQQITLVWTQNGGGTSIATTTGVSNIALAFLSGTGYSATLPATMAGFASPTATTIRMCIDLD
jgi:hypothetical protein